MSARRKQTFSLQALTISGVFAILIVVMVGFYADTVDSKSNFSTTGQNLKWASKSFLVCTRGSRVLYEGFSRSSVEFDSLTKMWKFTDPNTGSKIRLQGDCKVDSAKRAEYAAQHSY